MPSSSEFPKEPIRIDHLGCSTTMVFAADWPPRVVVCAGCGLPLKLVAHDETTQSLAYRKI